MRLDEIAVTRAPGDRAAHAPAVRAAGSWALASIRGEWASALFVAVLIAVASGAVMAGVAGARRAGSAPDRYFATTGWPSVLVFTETPVDQAWLATARDDPRVTSASAGSMALAGPVGFEPGLEATTMVLPDDRWGQETSLLLTQGRYPAPGARDEVAINELSLGATSLRVGDSVDLHLLTPDALSACIQQVPGCEPVPAGQAEIVGVVRTPQDLTVDAYSGLQLYARPEFLDARGGPGVATGHLVFVNLKDGVDADAVAAEWSTSISDGDVQSDRQDRRALDRAAELQRPALLAGAGIAAVAGGIVVAQALARLLARRRSEAEVLAMLGLIRRERAVGAIGVCLPSVLVGTAGGVLVAVALSPLFPLRVLRRADPNVGVNADWAVLGAGVAVTAAAGVALAALVSYRWAARGARDNQRMTVSRAAAVAAALGLGPVPTTGTRFALERGRGAHAVPVVPALVGAILGLTVAVMAFVVRDSIDGLLESPARYGAPWDLQIGLRPDNLDEAATLADDDRIVRGALVMSAELDVEAGRPAQQVAAMGYEAVKGSLTPVVLDGRFIDGPNEAVVASDTMRDLGVDIGDTVVVRGPLGEEELVVVGRVVKPIVGDSAVSEGIIVPLDAWASVGALELVAEIDAEGALLADVADTSRVDEVEAEVVARGFYVDRPFQPAEVTVLREVRAVPIFLALFTGLLGAVAAAHALVVAGRRRRRDLAVLRALGLRPGQSAGIIRWQGAVLTLVALTIALPAGAVLGGVIWKTIAGRIHVVPTVDLPFGALAMLAVVTLAGALLLAVAPGAWASRARPGAALHEE